VILQSHMEMCYIVVMRNDDYSLIWKALSEPIRRQILDMLRERPHTTGELAQAFEVSRFAVMKHLTSLEQSGLITVRKQGRERWNTLNPVPLQLIYERWLRPYEATWSSSLLQLKALVEGGNNAIERKEEISLGSVNIAHNVLFQASSEQLFDALTTHIASWWGYPYVHNQATDITLEPCIGGRLYERWENANDGFLWGRVHLVKSPQELHVVGSLGMDEPTYGVMIFYLEPQKQGTLLHFTLDAFGKVNQQTQESYEAGWKDLLDIRLRAFIERDIHYGIDQDKPGWFFDARQKGIGDKTDAPVS
jgi:Predicted transcriptional regulators